MSTPPLSSFAAVLFDLDGVITDTASVHATAWRQMFNTFLSERAAARGEGPHIPFTIEGDYAAHVDGKPRYEGVSAFLASRGIELPEGADDDPADAETIKGLGNRKNVLVRDAIEQGVEVFDTTVEVVDRLLDAGVRCAVVSSSRNAMLVLKSTGLLERFEYVLDGNVAAAEGIAGKPRPDTYEAAARKLGIPPARCVVIEDAVSGVQAGRAGDFGLVVGVDRLGQADELRENGADVVVEDLAELEI